MARFLSDHMEIIDMAERLS